MPEPAPQNIDISAGLVPKTPSIDISAGLVPKDAAPQTQSQPEQSGAVGRFMTGVGQELKSNLVDPVMKAIAPPTDSTEHVIHAVGGLPALDMYRLGRHVVGSAEGLIKAPAEHFQKAKEDFNRAVDEAIHKDYRNALSSAGSATADMVGVMPGPGAIVADKARELTEGARPGGDLATPLGRDVADAGLMYAGEKAPEIVEGLGNAGKAVARKAGVGGLESEESLVKAAAGSASTQEKFFKENAERALPHLVKEDAISRIPDSPEGIADAAHTAKTKVWAEVKNELSDAMTNHPTDAWVDGNQIAQDIKDSVSNSVRNHEPLTAKRIDKWADTFATAYPNGQYPLNELGDTITHMNAKLRETYTMDKGSRAALLERQPQLGMYEDAADSMREKMDTKLQQLGSTKDSAELRKDYGALSQLERVFEKRGITYGRQAPISLKQGLSYMAAMSGHPLPVAVALAEKYLNSPGYLIRNALNKAVPKTPSSIPKIAGRAAQAAVISNALEDKGAQ